MITDAHESLPSPIMTLSPDPFNACSNHQTSATHARRPSCAALRAARTHKRCRLSATSGSSHARLAACSCRRHHVALLEERSSATVPHQHAASSTTPLLHRGVEASSGSGSGVENTRPKGVFSRPHDREARRGRERGALYFVRLVSTPCGRFEWTRCAETCTQQIFCFSNAP